MAAAMTDTMSGALNSLWISSIAKSTPVSGALNAADMPAAAPQVVSRRSSPLSRPISLETALPAMPPSCTLGPSRPSERPPSAQSVPSTNFAESTRHHGMSRRPITSASICGMPEPCVKGSHTMRRHTTPQITTRNANHRGRNAQLDWMAAAMVRRRVSACESARR